MVLNDEDFAILVMRLRDYYGKAYDNRTAGLHPDYTDCGLNPSVIHRLEAVNIRRFEKPRHPKANFWTFCKAVKYSGFVNALNVANKDIILDRPATEAAFYRLAVLKYNELDLSWFTKKFGAGDEREGAQKMLRDLLAEMWASKNAKWDVEGYWKKQQAKAPNGQLDIEEHPYKKKSDDYGNNPDEELDWVPSDKEEIKRAKKRVKKEWAKLAEDMDEDFDDEDFDDYDSEEELGNTFDKMDLS